MFKKVISFAKLFLKGKVIPIKLNKTVLLIDSDFLIDKIVENFNFYTDLYPQKKIENINLAYLVYQLVLSAKLPLDVNQLDIIFSYSPSNSIIPHCKQNDLTQFAEKNKFVLRVKNSTFLIHSYPAAMNGSSSGYTIKIIKDLISIQTVDRLIIVADNKRLNSYLQKIIKNCKKEFYFIKNYKSSHITLPFQYANIDYPIAYSLGMKAEEI